MMQFSNPEQTSRPRSGKITANMLDAVEPMMGHTDPDKETKFEKKKVKLMSNMYIGKRTSAANYKP